MEPPSATVVAEALSVTTVLSLSSVTVVVAVPVAVTASKVPPLVLPNRKRLPPPAALSQYAAVAELSPQAQGQLR